MVPETPRTGLEDDDVLKLLAAARADMRHGLRRFAAILPEIGRRQLWRGTGHASPVAFAADVCGMAPRQTRRICHVYEAIEDLEPLRALFLRGTVGWTKFEEVIAIVDERNCDQIAAQLRKGVGFRTLRRRVTAVRQGRDLDDERNPPHEPQVEAAQPVEAPPRPVTAQSRSVETQSSVRAPANPPTSPAGPSPAGPSPATSSPCSCSQIGSKPKMRPPTTGGGMRGALEILAHLGRNAPPLPVSADLPIFDAEQARIDRFDLERRLDIPWFKRQLDRADNAKDRAGRSPSSE